MAELVWDQVGSRRFEAGTSRGVLYPPGAEGVVWNGLIEVAENVGGTPAPFYLDGMKFMDRQIFTDFSAKLRAFTYPDELDRLVGVEEYGTGLNVSGQSARRFGFSWRTEIGDDVDGLDAGYKIHLVYNALATPSSRGSTTTDSNVAPATFEWQIDTIPIRLPGFRPTAHYVVDSTRADEEAMTELGALIYGTPELAPTMPTVDDLLTIFAPGPIPSSVIDEDGGWTITGEDHFFDLTEDDTAFAIRGVKTTYSDENEYTMPTDDELEA